MGNKPIHHKELGEKSSPITGDEIIIITPIKKENYNTFLLVLKYLFS